MLDKVLQSHWPQFGKRALTFFYKKTATYARELKEEFPDISGFSKFADCCHDENWAAVAAQMTLGPFA